MEKNIEANLFQCIVGFWEKYCLNDNWWHFLLRRKLKLSCQILWIQGKLWINSSMLRGNYNNLCVIFIFFEQKERTPIHKTQQIIIIIWRENIDRNLLDNSEKFKLPFWRCFLPNTSCPAQLLSKCSLWIVVVTLEQTLNFH